MPVMKAFDLAYGRLRSPDLDKQEEFLTDFGMVRADRTKNALYMRGTDARLAEFGDVDVVRRIGAAHIEGVLGAIGADHPAIGQEFLLLVEIGRTQPPISQI